MSSYSEPQPPAGGYAISGGMQKILGSKDAVQRKCEELVDYADKMRNSETQANIFKNLELVIRSLGSEFANCTIKCYGSRLQGLTLEGASDIDLYVGKSEDFFTAPDFSEFHKEEGIQKLAETLKVRMQGKSNIFEHVDRPANHNVKCIYKPNNLKCDISFMTGLNYYNALFIRRMLDTDARAKQVALFMKNWLEDSGIRQFMSAYVTTLLVIHYLQSLGILPAGRECQPANIASKKVGSWECGMLDAFEGGKKKADYAKWTAADLVKGLFQYYSTFDFKNNVVCIYAGRLLNRSEVNSRSGGWGVAASMAAVDTTSYGGNVLLHVMGPFDYNNAGKQKIGENPQVFNAFAQLIKKSGDIIARDWRRV